MIDISILRDNILDIFSIIGITAKILDSLKTLKIDNIISKIPPNQSTQSIKYRLQLVDILEGK